MSAFDGQASETIAALAGTFGRPATCTAPDGTATALTELSWMEAEAVETPGEDGDHLLRRAVAVASTAELTNCSVGGRLTVDGEDWRIDTRRPAAGGAAWLIEASRDETIERSREAFRMGR